MVTAVPSPLALCALELDPSCFKGLNSLVASPDLKFIYSDIISTKSSMYVYV